MQAAQNAGRDALENLKRLRSDVFKGDDGALALAMGRPADEVRAWLDGRDTIDEDAEMKIRGLLQERAGE